MSLSASDNNGSYARVPPSGKTPPPAPSAAFAKRSVIAFAPSSQRSLFFFFCRAREIQGDGLGARYLPPALRGLGSSPNEAPPSLTTTGDGSTLPPTNYPPGFRRARAGTLPSNIQLAAQRFAASSTDSPVDQGQRQSTLGGGQQVSVNLAAAPPARPALRHSSTTAPQPPIAPSPNVTGGNSRLRSGSLTLPSGNFNNAFGSSSIFSSSWLSTPNGSAPFSVLDELRSVTSADSGADDFDVGTLDYLGLDDTQRPPPPAATISELRTQAQAAIAINLANPSRMRASTVSNPYRTRPISNSLLPTPAAVEEDYFDDYDTMGYDRQNLNAYDIPNSQGEFGQPLRGFNATDHLTTTNRPRAISVGILDDTMRPMQRRNTTADPYSYINELAQPNANLSLSNNAGNPSGILRTDKLLTGRSGISSSVRFPNENEVTVGKGASAYLLAPGGNNRSLSPKTEGQSTQLQTPTRSLWIGNLDSAVTSEQLIHVFAPYGAIESLRLLPEKVRHILVIIQEVLSFY